MLNILLRFALKLFFRVEVRGLPNFNKAGSRVLLIANHASLLDSLLVKLFMPGEIGYAIDEHTARRWWARPFINVLNYHTIDTHNPLSLKKLIDFLVQDNKILLFPEGRITNTNSLMKVYQSTGMVLDKSGATILPVYIEGAQHTCFSKVGDSVQRRFFPKITLTLLEPVKMELPSYLKGQAKRNAAVEFLVALMREMKFQSGDARLTLFESLLDARKKYGGRRKIVEDLKRKPLSYNQLITRAILLGRYLEKETNPGETIGIFLPTSIAGTVMIYAIHVRGCCPAMLNYGAGETALLSCINNAGIKRIYSSRKFIKEGGFEELLMAMNELAEVRYLEDVADSLSLKARLEGFVISFFARSYYQKKAGNVQPDDTAIILFTSGSEGLPKGVALSHANLLSNSLQVSCVIDLGLKDVLLNFLPMFHSFGLTAGTLLPIILGIRFFQYPSPLHYKIIPELAYEIDASIIFATNTFLTGYAQQAHPYDFHSIRYAFAGAEPLTGQTERIWMEKFGIRILQGYGATETSPVLATNSPLTYRRGSVGHFMPGVEYRLVDIPGIDHGKSLHVKGPNIMKGYLIADRPGEIVPPATEEFGEGWYDMGDIVDVDDEGYVFIRGRAKRFAKIGGEMVSLAAVENMVTNTWPDSLHAVISVPDPSKGEQLVLFTEYKDADRKKLARQTRKDGLSDLHIPKTVQIVDNLPILASGKIDYVTLANEHDR